MKKVGICCLALVVAAMFVPAAQAATKCYVLTNFCDRIQVSNTFVGGIQGTEVVGLWDWLCLGQGGPATLISGGNNAFGTQPSEDFMGGNGAGFNANYKFKPLTGLFDLYGTFDGVNAVVFQTNQPFTTTKGACNPLTPAQKAMPRTTLVHQITPGGNK